MNQQTLKLLEKALLSSPEDWETRSHLMEQFLASGQFQRAAELLKLAPVIPDNEADLLLKARVELEISPADAQLTLEKILSANKASAQAYLLLARIFQKRGLREEAGRKYGAATIIDESLHDPELEKWLGAHVSSSTAASPQTGLIQDSSGASAVPPSSDDLDSVSDEPLLPDTGLPIITFHDIGGMEEVIERIRMNIIYPFKNPEVFRKFNKKPGGGILMYGPPGCGKTHIARATAGECGALFLSIAITDILSKWIGESEQRLHQLFDLARRRSPAVIFIDEMDAIGGSRSDASPYMSSLVNVLLTEMDGIAGKNENLMVLAATNTPWRVDDALRRPGRFDRVLFVPPPDLAAREAILRICLRNLPVEKMDISKLAKQTERFSGADLRAAVERASEKAIYQEMRTGKSTMLTQSLITEAIKEMRPSTNEWLETARSYATYGNRSGLYDELAAFFEK